MSDDRDVRYAVADGVATLTLDRPERMNTISHAMLDRVAALLTRANEDAAVRVVILTGTGRAFCAGLDLNEAVGGDGIGASGTRHPPTIDLRRAPPTVLFAMDKPVICALNGSAAGYGMDLAIGCDIRVMAEGAKLAPAFVKRGIVPESGGTWLLPRMIGWAKAAELIFTGRTLGAAESLALGLVNHVVPDGEVLPHAERIAREIAANAPLAVQASKRMMRMGLNETFETHVQHVYLQLLPLFASDDFQEGMRSFLEKRPAAFTGS
ncbi:short chain enoyl-CoA hydratase /Enoyl-CoA hydratase [Sphingomonas palmae]|uniref:Short chain enoyl-CoA hydratase /Enoyl-CoA hydratase n=1 Tax=Sphingomonas palmae TaxID=1855283 RepID=A0A1H7PYM2_9SPHN|nr:enoyl-CoA hydratase/isomerase family protein [Sphingomonas palmae]SEL40365.1 short chain enoyl-CoA hydratase /Enoyl-CoA hydratase [Sphingomonas palmae]